MAQVGDDVRAALARIPNPIELLESLFALAPIALQIYEAGGRSLLVNDAFIRLFGSQPPPGYNVLEDEIAQQNGVLGLIHRAFAGETVTVPTTWYDPRDLRRVSVENGNRVAIQATFFPVFGRSERVTHVGVAFRDLTAELLERERADNERLLSAQILDQMDDGVLFADADGTIRFANRAARSQGVRSVDVPQERWSEEHGLVRPDGSPLPGAETPLAQALRGQHAEGLVHVRRPDGSVRAYASKASPVRNADGTLRGAVATTRDETERQRLLEESARTALFRERFIGILGHDLRAPLAAIRGNADVILANGGSPAPLQRAAARIASSADRMGRMISDLLDFAQARLGGGLPANRRRVELGELARAAVDEALAAHATRSIELRCPPELVARVDPDRVSQLLANLLDNALAYSPHDTPIRVALARAGGRVRLEVTNEGPGIPPEELRMVFDPFRRGRSRAEPERRGLGLGLYIVEQIAHAHGGAAQVESRPGRTSFTVDLDAGLEPPSPGGPVSETR